MRAAIIDCGTNTFHLLVAEYDKQGNHRILENEKRNVKLGEGGMLNNQIGQIPFERGMKAFNELAALAHTYEPQTIQAFATSAVRGALNGQEFVDHIHQQSGIRIQVIDGQREAQLISKGVFLALGEIQETALIMDIGGGSTEFILVKGSEILWKQSFELGVSRLLQRFRPQDPITPKDIEHLQVFFREALAPLSAQAARQNPRILIGCSGSFESLASMILRQQYRQELPMDIRSYAFREDDYRGLHQKLLLSSEPERLKMPGLVEARVDTIVHASVFIRFIRDHLQIPSMVFSNYALKEGAFSELLDS